MIRCMIAGLLSLVFLSAGAQPSAEPVKTVNAVNLARYAGKWFEIARFANWFQSQCASDVSAEYRLRPTGGIDVINQCKKVNGSMEQAKGLGKVIDPASNARLKVRFAPEWLSWLPFVWGDYWIIALADDYSWVVVGDPDRKFLWILARSPEMQQSDLTKAKAAAEKQGFDTNGLIFTQQQAN